MDPEKVNYHYCDDLPTQPLWPGARILVTGASGYVAHRLIPELVHRGYTVRCMFRNRSCPPLLTHSRIETVYADCLNEDDLARVMDGVDAAYYLIHSMRLKKEKFVETDQQAARNFREAARAAGLRRIIYLGGLGETGEHLSSHLKSRMEVGNILSQGTVPVIRIRAAIIIGTGSASYELLKSLILHNRLIPFLPQFNSLCQPVAIRDVIKYLVGVLELPDLTTRAYHIGGQDVMTYKELIRTFAKILNRKVSFFDVSWLPLPVEFLCRVYAYWLHLFISVPVNITALLLNSLRNDVVCTENDIRSLLPFAPLDFATAIHWAQEKEQQSRVFSHWNDVPPEKMSDWLPLCEFEAAAFKVDEHFIDIAAPTCQVFPVICRVGGRHGWVHANLLWQIRGWVDRAIGGVGLHRGRRDDYHLRVGDAVDFWRVEQLVPDRELLLRAEMISPGLSWLQFELVPRGEKLTRLILRAHFIPKPFWGDLYWLSMLRFHDYIFKGMLARFQKQAAASISEAKRSPPALAAEEEKVA
jgi:uncharacterized protein YbjT (DUF2867 family)